VALAQAARKTLEDGRKALAALVAEGDAKRGPVRSAYRPPLPEAAKQLLGVTPGRVREIEVAFSTLGHADALLVRALELWPANEPARELARDVLATLAHLSLREDHYREAANAASRLRPFSASLADEAIAGLGKWAFRGDGALYPARSALYGALAVLVVAAGFGAFLLFTEYAVTYLAAMGALLALDVLPVIFAWVRLRSRKAAAVRTARREASVALFLAFAVLVLVGIGLSRIPDSSVLFGLVIFFGLFAGFLLVPLLMLRSALRDPDLEMLPWQSPEGALAALADDGSDARRLPVALPPTNAPAAPLPRASLPEENRTGFATEAAWRETLAAGAGARSTVGSPAPAPLPVAEAPVLPGYELRERLGTGGMATVYRADDLALGRTVAVKVLRSPPDSDVERGFVREARIVGGLAHPSIVPVFGLAATQDGARCLVMNQVRGRPWSELLREGTRSLEEELEVLLRVGEAVAFAHSQGVVHRDLKPENVMVDRFGQVQLIDFGIAIRKGEAVARSAAGTPAYMAPEMAAIQLDRIGPLTDVYLLGGILYEILTGRAPHEGKEGEDPVAALYRAFKSEPLPPSQASGKPVPGDLEAICRRALAREPAQRFESAEAFTTAVRGALRAASDRAEAVRLLREARAKLQQSQVAGARSDERMNGLAAAGNLLERSRALDPGTAGGQDLALELERAMARAAIERREIYRATSAASQIAKLTGKGAEDPEAGRVRLVAFQQAFQHNRNIRHGVYVGTLFGIMGVLAISGQVWNVASTLLRRSPGSIELGPLLQFVFTIALGTLPSVLNVLLLVLCLGVRQGSGVHHRRALLLAKVNVVVLLASLGYMTWLLAPSFSAELSISGVVGMLLPVFLCFALPLLYPIGIVRWLGSDVGRLPWLDDAGMQIDAPARRLPAPYLLWITQLALAGAVAWAYVAFQPKAPSPLDPEPPARDAAAPSPERADPRDLAPPAKAGPGTPEASFLAAFAARDWALANERWTPLADSPTARDFAYGYRHAAALLEKEQVEEATMFLQATLEREPENPLALFLCGRALACKAKSGGFRATPRQEEAKELLLMAARSGFDVLRELGRYDELAFLRDDARFVARCLRAPQEWRPRSPSAKPNPFAVPASVVGQH
jgi:hypothetical protein